MELTPEAYERLRALAVPVDGLPFVVRVGDETIYRGALWTPISSLSYEGIVIMQPFDPAGRTVRLELGYPSPQFARGEDPRSDGRIRAALEQAGKLR